MIGWLRLVAGVILAASATLLLAPAQAVRLKLGSRNWWTIPRLWHRACLKALGIRVHVTGQMSAQRPLLLAANHVSWTDIHVLGSIDRVSFIAKSEVDRWPLIGRLSRLQGTVFVERQRRRATGGKAREVGERLAARDAMILFAEGTTSDGNFVLPFKSPLFAAAGFALEAGAEGPVVVQPVAIAYTRLHGMPMGRTLRPHSAWIGNQELLPHVVQLLREGAVDVEVRFGEPMEYRTGTDRKELAKAMERQVSSLMAAALRDPVRSS